MRGLAKGTRREVKAPPGECPALALVSVLDLTLNRRMLLKSTAVGSTG